MGELFERTPGTETGHGSANPVEFYEQCMEMVMIRTARVRRALRSRQHELVFGYTSGLDLIGHVSHNRPSLQTNAYEEADEFVGELLDDLGEDDTLLLVSDHGLQEGLHTEKAMVASTDPNLTAEIVSVLDIRDALDSELEADGHVPSKRDIERIDPEDADEVQAQLEDLGYM